MNPGTTPDDVRLTPTVREACFEVLDLRSEERPMGRKLRTVLRDERNIRQPVRFPHSVETVPEPF